MEMKDIVKKLQLQVLTGQDKLDANVTGGYTSDLLSDVIANSKEGDVWITLQTHQNIIAVARLKDLAGIIVVNNRAPDEETLKKAKEENVILMVSKDTAFVIAGKLYALIGAEG
jgi:serine kinase of HPr protein (carbohydrate metabolism regulator)